MNYYGTKDMAASFRTVRKNTVQIAEEIPESQYEFRAAPETRSVAQTLTHIAVATGFQMHLHVNKVDDVTKVNFPELLQKIVAEESQPRTKAEIILLLNTRGDEFARYLETLPDAFLAEEVAMPPGGDKPKKTRFEMLLSPKEHEMHHRAQLMVLQRMIGQVPHLTRRMQERMAQMQASASQAQAR
jgi:uncharacterized damage-inducible protein DinB